MGTVNCCGCTRFNFYSSEMLCLFLFSFFQYCHLRALPWCNPRCWHGVKHHQPSNQPPFAPYSFFLSSDFSTFHSFLFFFLRHFLHIVLFLLSSQRLHFLQSQAKNFSKYVFGSQQLKSLYSWESLILFLLQWLLTLSLSRLLAFTSLL